MSQDFGRPSTAFTDADKLKLDSISEITAATDISLFAAAFNAALAAPQPQAIQKD